MVTLTFVSSLENGRFTRYIQVLGLFCGLTHRGGGGVELI